MSVVFFFDADSAGQHEAIVFAEIQLCGFIFLKADLLAERLFSLVWLVHVVSVSLWKVLIVKLSFQKRFFVLPVRFLRRCLFQVVSVASRCKSKPDLSA
ncbi:TPA: hypothetical protein ACPJ0Y_004404 [Vibrio diabolicus]